MPRGEATRDEGDGGGPDPRIGGGEADPLEQAGRQAGGGEGEGHCRHAAGGDAEPSEGEMQIGRAHV